MHERVSISPAPLDGLSVTEQLALLHRTGVELAIENTHALRSDISFAFSYRDVVRVARTAGLAAVLDLFGAWIEPDLAATVAGSLDILRVVQVSDFVFGTAGPPNRWVPGDGDIPLGPVLADLLAAGYQGVFDIEVFGPAIEAQGAEQALARAGAWLTRMLGELGSPGESGEPGAGRAASPA